MKKLITFMLLTCWGTASAIPVQWTLENVTFEDGGAASGSFTYDAATNIYADVDITTTIGTIRNGTYYEYVNFNYPYIDADDIILVNGDSNWDLTGYQTLVLRFAEGLTNSGGNVAFALASSVEGSCDSPDCNFGSGARFVTSGEVTAVPIPAAVWLLGSALAGLGWLRRKQTA